jgi:tetrachlorobenzoquinone reductase
MQARIRSVRWESASVTSFVLEPLRGEHFPAFQAGAHIDVELRPDLRRSYSLLNHEGEADRYEIAVRLEDDSRGGSRHVHDHWRAGQVIGISAPANHFALHEDAAKTVLVAGGIGITPMLSMIARLETLARPWVLHYAFRSADEAAFLDRLAAFGPGRVHLHDARDGERMKLARVLAEAGDEAHVYCCGPERMLTEFGAAAAGRPPGRSHLEHFVGTAEIALDGGYALELRRCGLRIDVQAGETMLDALLNAGVNVGFACSEGVCGSCRVGVLAGVPDHRDQFLTDAEKAANSAVMVCCSGARTPVLALDL